MNKGSYNKVILVGHLGNDPDIKFTTSGTAVANMSIATNEIWRSAEGDNKEKTEWHRVVIFGKRADTAGEWLKKGQLVLIEGKLQTRQWEDKDKIKRYSTEVIADSFTMLGKKGDNGESSPKKDVDPEDDLPF